MSFPADCKAVPFQNDPLIRDSLAQPGVQVGQQRGDLLLGKTAGEGGHHSLARKNHALDLGVGGRSAAGQGAALEDAVQVWRNFFEGQVVVPVTVGATNLVEVLAGGLLRRERRCAMAARQADGEPSAQKRAAACSPKQSAHLLPMPFVQICRSRNPS